MKLAFLLTPFLIPASVVAAQHPAAATQPHGIPTSALRFELPGEAREVSLPFRIVNHHVLLPVTVNGQGPFQVILDTGMPMEGLILYDSKQVKALNLPYLDNAQVRVAGAGGEGKGMTARITSGLELGIGGLRILDARGTVVSMSPGFGAYHDGVIGAALFNHFAVTIDGDRGVLMLRRPEAYQPPAGSKVAPLVIDRGRVYVDAKVQCGDGEPAPVRLVVDLGASHTVSLNEAADRGIRVPQPSIATTIGRGVSGEIMGRVGRIRSLEIGGWTLANVIATFPDKAFHNPRGLDSKDGNLGNGALSRFLVTLDYAGSRMILEPSRRFSEPFEWDMSGMRAEPAGDGTVRVRQVLAGSAAEAAGILTGDRVVRIADEQVTEASYFSLVERLRREGATVAVELRRGDEALTVSLNLKRLI